MTRHPPILVPDRFSAFLAAGFLVPLLLLALAAGGRAAPGPEEGNEGTLLSHLRYRNLGPFRAGCWIGDIAAPEHPGPGERYTYYVAARNGGVWKTVNNGTTFEPIFDRYGTNAVGALAVAPSDPDTVWVGTGGAFCARSTYAGNGIWKSTDGGRSFQCMGLEDTQHIARIVIHPQNPEIVYVAALGHLFSENEERGVFKTKNGGRTWKKVLYPGPGIGVVDLAMNPEHPEVLYAAAYDKKRLPWHFEAGGEGSGIWRTRDGGAHWKKLEHGLPKGKLGRIGIALHRADPRILYAVVENLNPRPGAEKETEKAFDPFYDHLHEGCIGGEVYRTDNGGDDWRKVSPDGLDLSGKAAYSFNRIFADPKDPDKVFLIGVSMQYSLDGGKTWPRKRPAKKRFLSNFGDVRSFWIDPEDPEHLMLGSDGGLYASWDGGRKMFFYYHIPLGEVYDVETDGAVPYNIYAGLQDHETWRGPSNGWSGGVGIEDWVITGMWDGMITRVDPENNRWLYFTTQFGKHHRVDQLRGERKEIMPKAPEGAPPYRYTWTTPIALSPHNPAIVYTGGQMLLRSLDRGDTWEERSPDLTTNDAEKIAGQGHIMFCTLTTISESPVTAGVIWVGTDDGKVWVSRDHGAHWKECTPALALAGAPVSTWVSRVVASFHEAGTAYVAKSGFHEDRFEPFLYRTRDFGETWEAITTGLPEAPVNAVCEDRVNPRLLFAGTDQGVYVTFDGGKHWRDFRNNMPPVPVRDLLVHPREQDLVAGTYGRGVWVVPVSALQEVTPEVLEKPFHLFRVLDRPARLASRRASWGNYVMTGDAKLRTPNEPEGFRIFYYIREKLSAPLRLRMETLEGEAKGEWKTGTDPGIHLVYRRPEGNAPGPYHIVLEGGGGKEMRKARLLPALTHPVGDPRIYR